MVALAGSCRMRETECVGMVKLVRKLYGSRMGYHENILLRTSEGEGGEAKTKNLIM